MNGTREGLVAGVDLLMAVRRADAEWACSDQDKQNGRAREERALLVEANAERITGGWAAVMEARADDVNAERLGLAERIAYDTAWSVAR